MHTFNLKFCSFLFSISGLHPKKTGIFQNLLFLLAFSLNATSICLTFLLVIYTDMSLTETSDFMETFLLLIHGTLKQIALYIQKPKIVELLHQLDLFRKFETIEGHTKAKCEKTANTLTFLSRVYAVGNICAVFGVTIRPIIRGSPIFACYLPQGMTYGDVTTLHMVTYIVGIYAPCVGSDFLYMTLVFLAKIQFQLLNSDVEKLFAIDGATDGAEEERGKVKEWVDYHNFLLEFVRLFNDTFSITIFLFFGIVILSTCMELFILSMQPPSGDNVKYYSYIFILLFEFIAYYCLPAQLLTDEADKLVSRIWEEAWKTSDTMCSRKILTTLILMRCQKSVSIKAVVVDANFQTCLSGLKTIASYYMFLKTISKEK